MLHVAALSLAALLCLSPVAVFGEGFGSAIENGKSYGAIINSTMPSASSLPPESVPGYQTSSPPEAGYYGNPSAIGDAANQASAENEAAQALTEGFSSRPMFTIDQSTDPMFQRMGQVEENAASIAGAMQGEYSECQPVVLETPNPPTIETCYENRQAQSTTCSNVLNIEIEIPTDTVMAEGSWTSSSGDCGPDTWSNYGTVSCPSGFYGPVPEEIYRQARWRTSNPWTHDTDWQPFTSSWTARTEINCSGNQCTYRTKGIDQSYQYIDGQIVVSGPLWDRATCSGDKWYTRMKLKAECRAEPIAHDVWDNGCAELEARSQ
jgi:hypothetical protein